MLLYLRLTNSPNVWNIWSTYIEPEMNGNAFRILWLGCVPCHTPFAFFVLSSLFVLITCTSDLSNMWYDTKPHKATGTKLSSCLATQICFGLFRTLHQRTNNIQQLLWTHRCTPGRAFRRSQYLQLSLPISIVRLNPR